MVQSSKTFRVFVISTFADLKDEKNALQKEVFPKLRKLSMEHGFRLQINDLSSCVSEEDGLGQQTMKILLEEIKHVHNFFPIPNFIVLLGDRYGWMPLPYEIPAEEFEEIKSVIHDEYDRKLLFWEGNILEDEQLKKREGWYCLDANVVPPVYYLKSRMVDYDENDSDDLIKEAKYKEAADWYKTEKKLKNLLTNAINKLGWAADDYRRVKYETSAIEQEIMHGVMNSPLNNPHPKENVFCFFREIQNKNDINYDNSKDFFDFNENNELDKSSEEKLDLLKAKIADKLPSSNIFDYNVHWEENGISKDHIGKLCEDAFSSLEKVIKEQINEYEEKDSMDIEIESSQEFGKERSNFSIQEENREKIKNYLENYIKNPNTKNEEINHDSHENPLVFISHYSGENSRDKIIANAVYNELEAKGIKCWMAPHNISPDEAWDEAIVNAIENCQIMVVIFSDNVNSSDYIKNEVVLASDEGLDIIAFRIEDTLPYNGLEFYLRRYSWLDAFTEPLDVHIQKLVKVIENLSKHYNTSGKLKNEAPTSINTPEKPELKEYTIDLNYKPRGSESDPLIEGTIYGDVDESFIGFQIEFMETKSEWKSSKVGLNAEGKFMTRVHAEPNYTNEFNILLIDSNGEEKITTPSSFHYKIITEKIKDSQKKPLVFISHYSKESSRDRIIAHAVYGELESIGIKCWIAPNDILPSQEWDDAIVDAIDECAIMVVIFSDNVNSSDYIKKEVLLAADEGLNLITFRIEDALPKKGLRLQLNRQQWLDAFTEPLDLHIQKLVKSVEALLEMNTEQSEKTFDSLKIEESYEIDVQEFDFKENSVDISFNDIFLNKELLKDFESSSVINNDSFSTKIILEGQSFIQDFIPMGHFGDLIAVDPFEIENYLKISDIIKNYLRKENSQKPLSIAVFGPPSSGKTFTVTQIVESMVKDGIKKLYFDASLFMSDSDIFDAFKTIQKLEENGLIPFVFFKNFDKSFNGKEYGWLKFFLETMENGSFNDKGKLSYFKRAIFIFETGTSESFLEFYHREYYEISDFIIRLSGYFNVHGPNKCSDNDKYFKLRRAVLLRSILERNAKDIFNNGKPNIETSISNAFLNIPKYKHGVRSIEAIIDFFLMNDSFNIEQSSLPNKEHLNIHVDGEIFSKLVYRDSLFKSYMEKLAREIHEDYRRVMQGSRSENVDYMKPWDELDETIKESNRHQAEQIREKLQFIDYEIIPAIDKPRSIEFTNEEVEKIAEMYHERWMHEKLCTGWKLDRSLQTSDHSLKLSPYLMPWAELSEEIKEFDRIPARSMPKLLEKAGFEIYSLKK